MGDVLQAYFAEINTRGGIYNRKIELRVMHGDTKSIVSNVKRLIDEEHVFAIVSGLTAGADDGVAALTQEKEVPFVGPSTLLPQRRLPLNRWSGSRSTDNWLREKESNLHFRVQSPTCFHLHDPAKLWSRRQELNLHLSVISRVLYRCATPRSKLAVAEGFEPSYGRINSAVPYQLGYATKIWWLWVESNHQPGAYETHALSI